MKNNNPNEHYCNTCKTYLPNEKFTFTTGRYMSYCKECRNKTQRDVRALINKGKYPKVKVEKIKYFKEMDEAWEIPVVPNKYSNWRQRLQTFEIMIALGWTFNEKNKLWFKEPIKTKDGLFRNILNYSFSEEKQ